MPRAFGTQKPSPGGKLGLINGNTTKMHEDVALGQVTRVLVLGVHVC